MPFKACPVCGQRSYSACGGQIWICPCCGEDLSAVADFAAQRVGVMATLRQGTAATAPDGAAVAEAAVPQLVLLRNGTCG